MFLLCVCVDYQDPKPVHARRRVRGEGQPGVRQEDTGQAAGERCDRKIYR